MQREIHIGFEFFSIVLKKSISNLLLKTFSNFDFISTQNVIIASLDNSHLPIDIIKQSPCKYLQHLTPMTALEPSS